MIAEERIMDILFEIKISEFEGGLHQVVQTNELPAIQINQLPNQPALHMNQHILTQPNANLPYPSRNSFYMDQNFLPIKQKNCKHSLYLNTVFLNNVIFQILK